jgi:hypothetical protein
VNVIVDVNVDAPVIVDVHVNGNANVSVIDAVDDPAPSRTRSCATIRKLRDAAITVPITTTPGFTFTCTATITGPITSTATSASTITEVA